MNEEFDFSKFEILTKPEFQAKKNLAELEKEELNYKDGIEDEEDEEEEKEGKEINLKDKVANYFTAKNKKSGLSQGLEALSNLLFLVEQVLTIAEKIKNLIFWKSKTATMFALFALMIVYLALSFLPFRYILILFYVKKFHRGYSYYQRVYDNNIE